MRNRKSIRLSGYDYSQNGWYYITICSYKRECMFGEIQNGKMVLNNIGKIVLNNLNKLPKRFEMNIDCFAVMPNHIHIILVIDSVVGVSFMKPDSKPKTFEITKSCQHMGLMNQTPTLGHIIRYFKGKISYELHTNGFNMKIFQRNFYEHIIRNEKELERIRRYINLNPMMWDRDRDNPERREIDADIKAD